MKHLASVLIALFVLSCATTESEEAAEQLMEEQAATFTATLDLPEALFNYSALDLPDHFFGITGAIDNTPANNQITDAGATLGRVLFYDNILSANNTIACASCHVQSIGFSDSSPLSLGFEGGETGRNSMGLANAKYYANGRFFWDERAATLKEQVLMPIQDEVEMGLSLEEMVAKIQSANYYEPLFEEAFGTTSVTSERVGDALAQFIRSMVSYEAKFDVGLSAVNGNIGTDFPNFTELENLGKDLFFSGRTQCSNCHETATFSGDQARNNGLDAGFPDLGLGAVTGNVNDNGKFKVNSLRNISLTSPYMHDGRFEKIREVINFYNNGIQNNRNLDARLRVQGNQVRRMNLNRIEVDALVAFLHTLTDESFVTSEKFSDPFLNR